MGRPIISNDLPQIADEFSGPANIILPRTARPDDVAHILSQSVLDTALIQRRLDHAMEQRPSYTWAHAAEIMLRELSAQ
jgi:hypothetical protein